MVRTHGSADKDRVWAAHAEAGPGLRRPGPALPLPRTSARGAGPLRHVDPHQDRLAERERRGDGRLAAALLDGGGDAVLHGLLDVFHRNHGGTVFHGTLRSQGREDRTRARPGPPSPSGGAVILNPTLPAGKA